VAEDSRATPSETRESLLYCLNTSNQIIPVLNSGGQTILFRDWEEISATDTIGQAGWNQLISQFLGGLHNHKMEDTFCLMDIAIPIPTVNGKKLLQDIVIGDEIELTYNNTTRVIGIVEGQVEGTYTHHWLQSCIEKTYTPTVNYKYRRITTLKTNGPPTTLIGRHLITESGTLVACVNGTVLPLRDFTEIGIDNIHKTYPFVAERLAVHSQN
jgi:hypothetical protein